jgi:hypothetical protein
MTRTTRPRLLPLVLCGLLAASAAAQEKPDPRRAQELQNQAFAAIDAQEYEKAAELLRGQIEAEPKNFVPYYNLACVLSLKGDAAGGADMLIAAVERGFVDLWQMERDDQLAPVRKRDEYLKLVKAWPRVLARNLEANIEGISRLFGGAGGAYTTTRDDKLRIAYLSAMDATSTQQAREDISRLCAWGLEHVFADLAAVEDPEMDAWVVVVLPTGRDFLRWLAVMYGPAAINNFSGIGGSYVHDDKRLVAQDLGATLRHEFFHVLHWRSMTRLGQDHPIWIQEGLCSLVEDYDEVGASLKPVPSWRTNIALRLARGGSLMPISRLAAIPRHRFTAGSPLAHYGQARTVFLYLYEHGKLKDWYAHYTAPENFAQDPSGIRSLEAVLEKPIAEIERDYRQWVRSLPEVAEQLKPGSAGLGVDIEGGSGDGPVIVEVPRAILGKPNPAAISGLRKGDVITAIDGRATRDMNELVRVLGEKRPGEEVEVSYRRGSSHGTTRVRLGDR